MLSSAGPISRVSNKLLGVNTTLERTAATHCPPLHARSTKLPPPLHVPQSCAHVHLFSFASHTPLPQAAGSGSKTKKWFTPHTSFVQNFLSPHGTGQGYSDGGFA